LWSEFKDGAQEHYIDNQRKEFALMSEILTMRWMQLQSGLTMVFIWIITVRVNPK
jgi:hypothetical protein